MHNLVISRTMYERDKSEIKPENRSLTFEKVLKSASNIVTLGFALVLIIRTISFLQIMSVSVKNSLRRGNLK